ncbi:FtsX-like permease family protein [Streptomyces californicus]|uniref:FtsX-like permease family protein n=1 Tax=Streptomyces californicus TaxID=67351 RepID=UPI0036BA093C
MVTSALALGRLRRSPAAFAGPAVALCLSVATLTLFGSLFAAEVTATGPVRGEAEGPGLMVIAGAFGEIAILVAFFVVVNALGYTLRRQQRELALLRTIAATPRQVRRLVRVQVCAVVLLTAVPGWALGSVAAGQFLSGLRRMGLAAPGLRLPTAPAPVLIPMAVALAATLVVALAASAVTARKFTRPTPAAALTASSTEHRRAGVPRFLAGVVALAGGLVLLRLAATRPPDELDKAGQAALLGSLVLLIAVALTGPFTARLLVAVLGAPVRTVAPGAGWMAQANLRGYAKRLSSAVVPVALLVGLSGTMLIMTNTAERAAGADTGSVTSATDVWLRQAELGMLACFAAVSTVSTLVAVTSERRREFALLRLVGAARPQVMRMLTVEAALITTVGVVLGAVVAGAASAAFSTAVTDSPVPSVPVSACWVVVAGAALLTVPAVLATGLRAIRGPAVEEAGGGRD